MHPLRSLVVLLVSSVSPIFFVACDDATMSVCGGGTVQCGAACVDTRGDAAHCGACGAACEAGQVCVDGACSLFCAPGLVACGNRCVDPATDNVFCGAAGDCLGANQGAACLPGTLCSGGACSTSCGSPLIACDATCVDPMSNPRFCGASGDCVGANSGTACPGGPNLVAVCAQGACGIVCNAGYGDCDAAPGCETNTTSDVDHCGRCGRSCAADAVSVPSCQNGQCAYACATGFADCTEAAGCETSTADDENNCGACGAVCAVGDACVGGSCVATFAAEGTTRVFTVPTGVSSIFMEAWGAQGAEGGLTFATGGSAGLGGYAAGTRLVVPGETFNVVVGSQAQGSAGGFNGGGSGGAENAGGGGGASDVRYGGTAESDRILVAGGGGGGGTAGCVSITVEGGDGGAGGGGSGLDGVDSPVGDGSFAGGGEGASTTGGLAGTGCSFILGIPGTNPTGGVGGDGGDGPVSGCASSVPGGGGGGGGFLGGAGGGAGSGGNTGCVGSVKGAGGGGGGGTSSTIGVTNGSTQNGVRLGDGRVIFTYSPVP